MHDFTCADNKKKRHITSLQMISLIILTPRASYGEVIQEPALNQNREATRQQTFQHWRYTLKQCNNGTSGTLKITKSKVMWLVDMSRVLYVGRRSWWRRCSAGPELFRCHIYCRGQLLWNDEQFIINTWWRRDMVTLSSLLAFVRGIHRSPVDSPHKGPVMRDFNVFFCCKAEQAIEETVELVVIRDAMTLMRRPCNDLSIIYPKYVLTIKIS